MKMQENMTHNKEKKTIKTKPKMTQVAELAENNNKELPRCHSGEEPACQRRKHKRCRLDP